MENQTISQAPTKKNSWTGKIETKEEALKVIKDASYGFYLLAVIQAAIGFALGMSLWLDAVLYVIFATILLKWKSVVAAVFLLLLSAGALAMTFINKINPESGGGGTNIFLAVIILWASIRAIQATVKLHKLESTNNQTL